MKPIIMSKSSLEYNNLTEDQQKFYDLNKDDFITGNYKINGVGLKWYDKRGKEITIKPSSKIWINGDTEQITSSKFISEIERKSRPKPKEKITKSQFEKKGFSEQSSSSSSGLSEAESEQSNTFSSPKIPLKKLKGIVWNHEEMLSHINGIQQFIDQERLREPTIILDQMEERIKDIVDKLKDLPDTRDTNTIENLYTRQKVLNMHSEIDNLIQETNSYNTIKRSMSYKRKEEPLSRRDQTTRQATQVQPVTNEDAFSRIDDITKQVTQVLEETNNVISLDPIPEDEGQGKNPVDTNFGLNPIPQNLKEKRMQDNVEVYLEDSNSSQVSGNGYNQDVGSDTLSVSSSAMSNTTSNQTIGATSEPSFGTGSMSGSGYAGDVESNASGFPSNNEQGLDGTGFNTSVVDTLVGSKDIKAKYPDAIHEDALALFFGSSTDPLWDDFLFQERTKRWEDPKVLESKRDYLYKQSLSMVSLKGPEIFVYELVYPREANIDLILKENHEILQLYMSLSKNRRSDQLVVAQDPNVPDPKDPEVELTPEQQDSLVVGNPDPVPTEPNLAEPEMFNKPPAFFDKAIMNELDYVERVMLNGLTPLKDMRYFRGQPRYVNRNTLLGIDRNIIKGVVDPTVKLTKLNSTDNPLGVQVKGDVNVKDSSNLGIRILKTHSCGFKI